MEINLLRLVENNILTPLPRRGVCGLISFFNHNYYLSFQYIRLSHDTHPNLVLQLLIDEWKLRPPKMVITVHGGAHNFQLQPKLQRFVKLMALEFNQFCF